MHKYIYFVIKLISTDKVIETKKNIIITHWIFYTFEKR